MDLNSRAQQQKDSTDSKATRNAKSSQRLIDLQKKLQ